MTLKCGCQNCHNSIWILEVHNHDTPYTASIMCYSCGKHSAFVISFPFGTKKPRVICTHILSSEEYICGECFGVFEKGITDEQALDVYRRQTNNSDAQIDGLVELCCVDCFNKNILPKLN